jgi:hypothetical protein
MICHSGLRFQALPVQAPAKAKEGALGTEAPEAQVDQGVVVEAPEAQVDLVVVEVRVDQVPVAAVEAEAIKKMPLTCDQ